MMEKNEKVLKKLLIFTLLNVFVLSIGHAYNTLGVIALSLLGFVAIVLLGPKQAFLPIMLFYLPWSPVMGVSPDSFTFYTIIVPVFFVSFLLSKEAKQGFVKLKLDNLLIVSALIAMTLVVKLFLGHGISMTYLFFMVMLVFMPTYLDTYKGKISFEWCIIFFAAGIIAAGIASNILMKYSHMRQYIDVYEWADVGLTRLSGFYLDSNFYSAHIIVAICGLIMIAINKSFKKGILLFVMVVALIYFGLLSVSKMFLLLLVTTIGISMIAIFALRGKGKIKIGAVFCMIAGIGFILSSKAFMGIIKMYMIRFASVQGVSTLTTGRSDILVEYVTFFRDSLPTAFLFGQGCTDVGSTIMESAHNSVIQLIYQFGAVGAMLMIVWIFLLSKSAGRSKKTYFHLSNLGFTFAFAVVCFMPWMALDILFFDEFFYITSLFFIGKNYLMSRNPGKEEGSNLYMYKSHENNLVAGEKHLKQVVDY